MRSNRNRRSARNSRPVRTNSSRRELNCAESYGWEVEERDAREAYDFACDYFGKENLDDQIVDSLSVDELASSLAFIFRMNDFREWEAYKNGEDLDDLDSSRKLNCASTLPYQIVSIPVVLRDWLDLTDRDYVSAKCKKLVDIADTLYNMGDDPEIVDSLKGEYKALYEEFGKPFWDAVLKDVRAIDSQMSADKVDELEQEYTDWTFRVC